MRARSLFGLVGVLGLPALLGGCGGSGTSGISVANPQRDLGGYVVTSQSGSPDAATSTDMSTGATVDAGGTSTGGTTCGSVTAAGDCNSDTLEYCDPTAGLQTVDCSSQGLTCQVDGTSGMADCVAGSSTGGGCGSVTTDGDCQGNTLEYCSSSGTLVTKDCSASSESCKVLSSGYAECK